MNFKQLTRKLDMLTKKYERRVIKLAAAYKKIDESEFLIKGALMVEIRKVCPHTTEVYHDTWHPHTRDGDQYYECSLCGNRRKV